MSYTTVAQVRSRMVTQDEVIEDEVISTLIEDAEMFIEMDFDLTKVDPKMLTYVTARMILRFLRNPDGIRQEQESTGPSSISRTYAGDKLGELYLTSGEKSLLAGKSPKRRAYTIDPLAGKQVPEFPVNFEPGWC